MNVLLIRPPRTKKSITIGELMYCEPLGLEVVYTLIKDLCRVTLFDMMADNRKLENVLESVKPDFVGLTTLCIDVENTRLLCRKVKSRDKNIVTAVGGTQTFFDAEAFFSPYIDYIITYTDRENVRTLIKHLRKKIPVPLIGGILSRIHSYEASGAPGRNVYLHPDISCTEKYRKQYSYLGYRPCAIMQTSAGCSAKCLFCIRWRLEGGRERALPLAGVISHIRNLPEDHVMIIDNDFLNDKERLARFCDLLEKYGIRKNFICYASVRGVLENENQMERLAENGLKTVLVGYESFSETELDLYKKEMSPDSAIRSAAILKKHGIDCWASFIFHPDWSANDFQQLRRHIRRLRPEISTFSPLTPFPGLPLYSIYKERLLFDKEDYGKWSFGEVCVKPSKITLKQYYYEMLKTILSVHLAIGNTRYMVDRFGIKALFRISKGSINVFFRYLVLIFKS